MNAHSATHLHYWGLDENPFANIPDPAPYYPSESHSWALGLFEYAVRERKAAGLLTGEYGTGKTTTIRVLLGNIGDEFVTALIDYPIGEGEALFRTILEQLGEPAQDDATSGLCDRLEARFADNSARGKHTLVVLDEAQSLPADALHRELRMLLDLRRGERNLLTLLLVGQDDLWQRISRIPRFADDFAVKCRLQELDLMQTAAYIRQRIERCGGRPGIFPEEALRLIHDSSKGIPRRINSLCDLSLLMGSRRHATAVDAGVVKSIWV